MENKSIVEKLCGLVAGSTADNDDLGITREEASELLQRLLHGADLKKHIERVAGDRRPVSIVHTKKYTMHFEVFGHNGVIDRVCFDHTNGYIFTGGADGIVKIWNITEGMLIRSLYGHCSAINDICISQDGEYLVTVDTDGILNVWHLESLRLAHSIPMNSEIIFCEFIRDSQLNKNTMSIVFILATGVIRSLRFNNETILETKNNNFMVGENFKAICITDGGRFVMCGTWLPFLLVYDTHSLGSIIVMDKYKVQSICAAKGCLKFAASSENKIYTYTFFKEGNSGTSNFKKRKGVDGCWKRTMCLLPPSTSAERICFLASYLLVVCTTEGMIRVYDDAHEIISISGENGCIYAHPTRDIFVIAGINLSFYEITQESHNGEFCCRRKSPFSSENRVYATRDKFCYENSSEIISKNGYCITMFMSDVLPLPANDCAFSDDGRYFVISNDHGVIRTYSTEGPVSPPSEQFFVTDFNRIGVDENANYEYTVDFSQIVNPEWKKMDYRVFAGSQIHSEYAERLAAKYLEKEHLDQTKFSELYLLKDDAENESVSSDDATWNFSSSSSHADYDTASTESENTNSDYSDDDVRELISEASEEERLRLRIPRASDGKRRIVESDEEEGSRVLLRRNIDKRSEAKSPRLRKDVVANNPQKRRYILESDEMENSCAINNTHPAADDTVVIESTAETNDEEQDRRSVRPLRRIVPEKSVERMIRRRAQSIQNRSDDPSDKIEYATEWLRYFGVYRGDTVYFDSGEYQGFLSQDDRFTEVFFGSGYYTVLSMKIMHFGRLPYVAIELKNVGTVKFYEYDGSCGILCIRSQREANGTVRINRDEPVEGPIENEEGMSVKVQERWYFRSHILRGEMLDLVPVPYDGAYRSVFGRMRCKEDRMAAIEVLNYDLVNQRIRVGFYKNKAQFLSDLSEICEISRVIFPMAFSFCKEILELHSKGSNTKR